MIDDKDKENLDLPSAHKDLLEKYKEAIEVLRNIDKLPLVSYHLERFKHKYREEFK
jgi:hypothetical protein